MRRLRRGRGTGGFMRTKEKNRYESLDGIRGIAAVFISCFAHYNNAFGGARPLLKYFDNKFIDSMYGNGAQLWVEVFFCISGFVIFEAYFDRICDGEHPMRFGEFICRRAVRIFPLFWATTAAAWGLQWFNLLTSGEIFLMGENDLHHLFLNLFGLQNISGLASGPSFNAPAWFLSAVLVCYVIFYLLASLLKKNMVYGCAGMVLFGAIVVHSYLLTDIPFLGFSMGRGYLSFFWGVLLAIFVRSYKGSSRALPLLAGCMLLALWGYCYYRKEGLVGDFYTTSTFYVCTGLLLLAVYAKSVSWLLTRRIFLILGKVSFSVYLWNFPIQAALTIIQRYFGVFDYTSIRFWLFHLVLSIGAALASGYWLEPLLNRKFTAFIDRNFGWEPKNLQQRP